MTAEKKPKFDPKSEAEKQIAEVQARYTDALSTARKAAATTATEAWQSNYQEQRRWTTRVITKQLAIITSTAKAIEAGGTTEEWEKGIKDAVKAMAEERERAAAWVRRAVDPYSATVMACYDLRSTAARDARRMEDANPLIARGLTDAVNAIVATWPVPTWNEVAGTVGIVMPKKDESATA
jgi:hypothetical protein